MTAPIRYRVLLIEDNAADARLVLEMAKTDTGIQLDVTVAPSLAEGLRLLAIHRFDVVLADLGLPDSQGIKTFEVLHRSAPTIPMLVLTGTDDIALGLLAMKAGAQDYLVKGEVNSNPFMRAVHHAVERKKIEDALRTSERRYREVVETTGDGIWIIDAEFRATFVSARMAEMLAYTPEEIVGHSIFEFFAPAESREAEDHVAAMHSGVREQFEFPLRRKDGSTIFVIISTTPLFEEGKFAGAVGAMTDITKRVIAEDFLSRSESALREAQRIAHLGSWTFDLEAQRVRASDETFRLFDLDVRGETAWEDFRARIHQEDRQRVDESITNAIASGHGEVEFRIGCRDGGVRFVHSIGAVSKGQARSLTGTAQDITTRIRAENALKRSEAVLQEAQRIAHIGHWSRSTLTGEGLWSDEHYRILGIPIGSIVPTHEFFVSMIEPEDLRRLTDEIERLVASSSSDDSIAIDLRMTTPEGKKIVVSETAFADRDAGGNVIGFHGTFQDITGRVAIEDALRKSEAELAIAQQIAHVGSWTLDVETGDVTASAETYRLFDLPAESRQGAFSRRIHEDDRKLVEDAVAGSLTATSGEIEFRIVHDDGSIRTARAVARQRDGVESLSIFIGTIEDITEKKLAAQTLREHAEQLQQTNLELERFNRLAVGRELRMVELKQQINELCAQLGRPSFYAIAGDPLEVMETT